MDERLVHDARAVAYLALRRWILFSQTSRCAVVAQVIPCRWIEVDGALRGCGARHVVYAVAHFRVALFAL